MTEEEKVELFQYRAGMTLGSTLYIFFGWYSQTFLNVSYDTLIIRAPIGILGWVLFLISFKSELVLKSLRYAFVFGLCLSFYQYMSIFAQSNYHVYFSVGLMALLFVGFNFVYHVIDIIIAYVFMLICGYLMLDKFNPDFLAVYLIDSTAACIIYIYLIRRRIRLLKMVTDNLEQLKLKQNQIDEENQSLIKIGKLATQVAHDIRSPVTALESLSQILGNEIDPQKKRLIENAAKRINDIANKLVSDYKENLTKDLSLMKIDRTINLNSLVEDVIEEKKLSLDSKHKITFRAPESIPQPQHFDPVEFQRVVSNILNNSIEAFEKDGLIDVSLYIKDTKIQLVIRDNGKGITQEQLLRIFDKASSTKATGIGFGLSHAKEYINSIGGEIALDSMIGRGTSVTITL